MMLHAVDTEPRTELSFIVRVSRDQRGRLRGFVERVRTGEKRPFHGAGGISALIERMVTEARINDVNRSKRP